MRAAILTAMMNLAPVAPLDLFRFLRVPAIVSTLRAVRGRACHDPARFAFPVDDQHRADVGGPHQQRRIGSGATGGKRNGWSHDLDYRLLETGFEQIAGADHADHLVVLADRKVMDSVFTRGGERGRHLFVRLQGHEGMTHHLR